VSGVLVYAIWRSGVLVYAICNAGLTGPVSGVLVFAICNAGRITRHHYCLYPPCADGHQRRAFT
jgi:hypothetical protein